jgi:hypothetical protein
MGGSILNIWHGISAKWPALSMSHGVAHTLAHCDCDDSDKLLSCHGKPTCKSQILSGFLPSLIFPLNFFLTGEGLGCMVWMSVRSINDMWLVM